MRDYIPKDYSLHDALTEGLRGIKEEIVKWKNENTDEEWLPFVKPGN